MSNNIGNSQNSNQSVAKSIAATAATAMPQTATAAKPSSRFTQIILTLNSKSASQPKEPTSSEAKLWETDVDAQCKQIHNIYNDFFENSADLSAELPNLETLQNSLKNLQNRVNISENLKKELGDTLEEVSGISFILQLDNKNKASQNYDEEVHKAAATGDVEKLRKLKSQKANLEVMVNGQTPLHVAYKNGKFDVVQELIKNLGVNPNVKNARGATIMHHAAQRSDAEAIKRFNKLGVSLDTKDKFGRTPLHRAVDSPKQNEVITTLIELGASTTTKDILGSTPLVAALGQMNFPKVMAFISKDKVKLKDHHDVTKLDTSDVTKLETSDLISTAEALFKNTQIDNYTKEYLRTKFLGHSWKVRKPLLKEKENQVEDPGQIFYPPYFAFEMLNSTQAFNKKFPATFSNDEQAQVDTLLKHAINRKFSSDLKIPLDPTQPLAINTGFSGHCVEVLFYEDHIVIANKGAESRRPIEIYKIDPNKVTKEKLEQIKKLGSLDPEKYIEWLENLPQELGAVSTPMTTMIEESYPFLKKQEVHNCAWESLETSVYAFLALNRVMNNNDQSAEALKDVITATAFDFKQWLQYTQLFAIQQYLEMHSSKEMHADQIHPILQDIFLKGQKESFTDPELKRLFDELEQKYLTFLTNTEKNQYNTQKAAAKVILPSVPFVMQTGVRIEEVDKVDGVVSKSTIPLVEEVD